MKQLCLVSLFIIISFSLASAQVGNTGWSGITSLGVVAQPNSIFSIEAFKAVSCDNGADQWAELIIKNNSDKRYLLSYDIVVTNTCGEQSTQHFSEYLDANDQQFGARGVTWVHASGCNGIKVADGQYDRIKSVGYSNMTYIEREIGVSADGNLNNHPAVSTEISSQSKADNTSSYNTNTNISQAQQVQPLQSQDVSGQINQLGVQLTNLLTRNTKATTTPDITPTQDTPTETTIGTPAPEPAQPVQQVMTAEDMYQKGDDLYNQKSYSEAMVWFRQSANLGNTDAMNYLSAMYSNGQGVKVDDAESFRWKLKAADAGNAGSMYNVGQSYQYSYGVKQDMAQALYWYKKSSDAGNSDGMFALGFCYLQGNSVERNGAIAVEYFRKAIATGYDTAEPMFYLGACYYDGNGVDRDYAAALSWYKKSAEMGNGKAMYYIGICYENGYSVTKDITEATEWYAKAAKAGYAPAVEKLKQTNTMQQVTADELKGVNFNALSPQELMSKGRKYFHDKMYEAAAQYLVHAYEKGESEGALGAAYSYDILKNYPLAIKYYKIEVDKGDIDAMTNLANYYNGTIKELPKDMPQAVSLYKMAALQGQKEAMEKLGCIYRDGNGVPKNYPLAMDWFIRAADPQYTLTNGNFYVLPSGEAMEDIGEMYEHGWGCKLDLFKALTWYKKALHTSDEKKQGIVYIDPADNQTHVINYPADPETVGRLNNKIKLLSQKIK